MKNLKFSLCLFVLLILGWSTQAQTVVQIGSGTSTALNLPISGSWGYSYSQQIYTKAQIDAEGLITKIYFYYATGTTTPSLDWVIYMGHTNKSSFADSTDFVPVSEMIEVFNSQVTYPSVSGWMEIVLSKPFHYNNIDNLVIAVDENTAGNSPISWRTFTSAANTGIVCRSDVANPDPASPPPAESMTGELAQVKLHFSDCNAVSVFPFTEGFEIGNTNGAAVGGCWVHDDVTGTVGWKANTNTTGTQAPRTGNFNAILGAFTNEAMYYAFELTEGVSYTVNLYARQYFVDFASIDVKFGNHPNRSSMTNEIISTTIISTNADYQLLTGNFTPTASGVYYVGIYGRTWHTGWGIVIDDFELLETPTVTMDWCNLDYPATHTMESNETVTVYARGFKAGVTDIDYNAPGPGVKCWIGYSDTDTNPSTWTNWTLATYDNEDYYDDYEEYQTDLGPLSAGTYYYASRWSYNDGIYKYGGYDGEWNGTTNVSGILNVTSALGSDCSNPIIIAESALPYAETNGSNCGLGNNYTPPYLGNYSSGEDVIYRLDITNAANVLIEMTSHNESWTGIAIFDNCPDIGTGINHSTLGNMTQGQTHSMEVNLAAGSYYIMIDTYTAPNCITNYDLNISITSYQGSSCSNPIIIDQASLPYAETNRSNCGMGNNYTPPYLGNYGTGEDIIYRLDITNAATVLIEMTSHNESYTGIAIFDNCPDTGTGIEKSFLAGGTAGQTHSMEVNLAAGSYYIMIDTYTAPNCITNYDLNITVVHAIADVDIENDVQAVSVCQGTSEATVIGLLAPEIVIKDAGNNEFTVDLVWNITGYDANTPANYAATGTFSLPENVIQSSPVTVLEVNTAVAVTAKENPTFVFETDYCLNATADVLPLISEEGIAGTWAPETITTNAAGDVSYTFTPDAGECASIATIVVTVNALPVVTCPADFEVTNPNPVNLTATPSGGIYAGIGITDNTFSANGLANGDYTITYNYTDALTSCANSCDFNVTVSPFLGSDCSNPIIITQASFPYAETNGSNCGLGNNYTPPYLGDYGTGEDVIYRLDITSEVTVRIEMTSHNESWTGLAVFDNCPDIGTGIEMSTLGYMTQGQTHSMELNLSAGSYYIMIDTYTAPNCITSYDLNMTVVHAIADVDIENDVQAVSVCQGTSEATVIGLLAPEMVIKDAGNNEFTVDLVWNITGYDANTPANYTATGTFSLPENVIQSSPVTVLEVNTAVTVTAKENPTFVFETDYCLNATADVLPLISEEGIAGTWAPETITTNAAGDVSYTFTPDAGECANIATIVVTVNALPVVTCPADFEVTNSNPVNLTATPAGGVYTGAGITGNTFSANGLENGDYTITYTYTDGATTCSNFCDFVITTNIPYPEIAEIDINEEVEDIAVCQGVDEADAIALLVDQIVIKDAENNEFTVNLVWTIAGYDANVPSVYNAIGTFELPATVSQTDPAAILEVTAMVTVTENELPIFIFATEYCVGATPAVLPTTSEDNITGTWFPAIIVTDAVGEVDYVFTPNANQCALEITISVTVNALPEVTCPENFTVTEEEIVALTGGLPLGGTYSGTGVTGSSFNPSSLENGEYTIVYSYTDSESGCDNSCQFTITVDMTSGINVSQTAEIGIYPNPNKGMFNINFGHINGKVVYQIYDTKGNIIANKNIQATGNTTEEVSLNLVPGVYFIKVVTTNQTIVEKLVIQ